MTDYGYPWGIDQDGLKEIDAACSACQEAGEILPGHYVCFPVDTKRWEIVRDALTESGWRALVKPR